MAKKAAEKVAAIAAETGLVSPPPSWVTTCQIRAGGHLHEAGEALHPDVTPGEIESMLRLEQIVDPFAIEAVADEANEINDA